MAQVCEEAAGSHPVGHVGEKTTCPVCMKPGEEVHVENQEVLCGHWGVERRFDSKTQSGTMWKMIGLVV